MAALPIDNNFLLVTADEAPLLRAPNITPETNPKSTCSQHSTHWRNFEVKKKSQMLSLPLADLKKDANFPIPKYVYPLWTLASPRYLELCKITLEAMEKSKAPYETKVFDYWFFQKLLLLQASVESVAWLAKEIEKPNQNSFPSKNDAMRLEDYVANWQRIYGPLNDATVRGEELLFQYKKYNQEVSNLNTQKLTILQGLERERGIGAIVEAMKILRASVSTVLHFAQEIDEGEELHLQNLLTHENSLYNVNPITNPNHCERFMLPRFKHEHGPSSLFVYHKQLANFVENNPSPKYIAIVEGCWPSIFDLSRTHPVRISRDPTKKPTKIPIEVMFEPGQTQAFERTLDYLSSKTGIRTFPQLHNYLKHFIMEYPLGVEAQYFFATLRLRSRHSVNASLFKHLSDLEAVEMMPDIFILLTLPERNNIFLYATSFDRCISPQKLLGFMTRLWYKIVFTVKLHPQQTMRFMDVENEVWSMFQIDLETTLLSWGFKGTEDFVLWASQMWNSEGKKEGLRIIRMKNDSEKRTFMRYMPIKT